MLTQKLLVYTQNNKWHGFINGIRTYPAQNNKWRGRINGGIFLRLCPIKREDANGRMPFIIPRPIERTRT
jgi:hypothetical protein